MQQHTHFKKPYRLSVLVMYTSGVTDTFWADFLGKEGCVYETCRATSGLQGYKWPQCVMLHFAVGV